MQPEGAGRNGPSQSTRPLFWALLGGALLLLGAVVVVEGWSHVRGRRESRLASAAAGRRQRTTPVAAIALAPLPLKSPLVARQGADAFGYPRSYVDRAALRSMLARKKFAQLSAFAEDLRKRFEADFRTEYYLRSFADAFGSAEAALEPDLDAWVNTTPDSFAPYLARGTHRTSAGFAMRGSDLVSKTDATNFAAMNERFDLATVDLQRSLVLAPRLIAPLRELMQAAMARDGRKFDELARRAFELCPACMQPRTIQQLHLRPRWGGSYRAMQAAAEAAPANLNPRFRLLFGYGEADRAHGFVIDKQLERALEHAERACKLGDDAGFLSVKGDILLRLKDTAGAVTAYRKALDLQPSDGASLVDLADAESYTKDWRAAHEHLMAGLRIDPTSRKGRNLVPTLARGLADAGWAAHQQGGREKEALDLLDRSAELVFNRDVEKRREAVLTSGFQGTDAELAALEEAVKAAPDDFHAHARLDYALSTRKAWTPILQMWVRYLERHPEDASAYRERAGTLMKLGRAQEAYADAERACTLGSSAACKMARR